MVSAVAAVHLALNGRAVLLDDLGDPVLPDATEVVDAPLELGECLLGARRYLAAAWLASREPARVSSF